MSRALADVCPLCEQKVARARSILDEAREMLVKCMLGKVDPRTGETSRKAALDLLDGERLTKLRDEDLLAECKRRGLSAGGPAVDLDAAEAAVLAGKA